MTYQPQVKLTCRTCLIEIAGGIRQTNYGFDVLIPSMIEAHSSAKEHNASEPTHSEFSAVLKSTGEVFYINLSEPPPGIEGRPSDKEHFN